MIIAGWSEDINDVPHALCPYHGHWDVLTFEDGLIICGKTLAILPMEREKILHAIYEGHMGISKCQYHARHCAYCPVINVDIKQIVESCPTCQCNFPQEPLWPLQPSPALEHPWQHLCADVSYFDGSEYLVITDYYSKMPIVQRIPVSQCNACKTFSVLKQLFTEHSIPETLHTDNGPQFMNAFFTDSAMKWKFDHHTS